MGIAKGSPLLHDAEYEYNERVSSTSSLTSDAKKLIQRILAVKEKRSKLSEIASNLLQSFFLYAVSGDGGWMYGRLLLES